MLKYVITGPQGSGKGTQARLLAARYGLVHISVGDILRWNVENRTKTGARIRRLMAAGELAPDELAEDVVKRRLEQHDWNFGFVLDGFPRNVAQARFFLESYEIDAVIHLDVPDAVVLERVLSRRLCRRCGLDYNLIDHRPAVADVCDMCGGPLSQRPDDTPSSARERLKTYREKTQPILELFRPRALVFTIDGQRSIAAVQEDIAGRLDSARAALASLLSPAVG